MIFGDELRDRMEARRQESGTGVGAAWARNLTEADRDGQRHLLGATDGRGERWVEVVLPRVEHDEDVPAEAIEHCAGDFPVETRLQDLQDRGPHFLLDVARERRINSPASSISLAVAPVGVDTGSSRAYDGSVRPALRL